MMQLSICLLLLVSIFCCCETGEFVEVKLSDGSPIVGKVIRVDDHEAEQFVGIPYVEPPIGSLRFKLPIRKAPWSEPLKCLEFSAYCVQELMPYMQDIKLPMSEDCLYINVWKPAKLKSATELPVMVYIHGGGFNFGTANLYLHNASVLSVRNNVITVSFNYRVGPLGFLRLDDSEMTGNQGLADQLEALKWVQENIGIFGGDSEKVTIFGDSAGAASVSYHVTSPLSAGLFRNAIMQSRVGNCPWAIMTGSKAAHRADLLKKAVGCDGADAIECLRKRDSIDVMKTKIKVDADPLFPFYPSIDGIYVKDNPLNLAKSGDFNKVNIIIGHNEREGWIFYGLAWPIIYEQSKGLTSDDLFKKGGLWGAAGAGLPMDSLAAQMFLREYRDENTPKMSRNLLEQIPADIMISCPVTWFANYTSQYVDTYFYIFKGISRFLKPMPEWLGSVHGAELEYVFGEPQRQPKLFSLDEAILSDDIQKTYAAFAYHNNPTLPHLKWPKFDITEQHYMNFGSGDTTSKQWINARRCLFWSEFIPSVRSFETKLGVKENGEETCSKDTCPKKES